MSKGTIISHDDGGLYNVSIERKDGDPLVDWAWCADLTENLTGDVGILEIAGDFEKGFNIQPGYDRNAVYSKTRDGEMKQVQPFPITNPTGEVFWNWAMFPGWQKWHRPAYRYATITAVDKDADTCSLTLDPCYATDAPDGEQLNINPEPDELGFTGVPIEYMSCNAVAFDVDDRVLVEFSGPLDVNDPWKSPKVIGFESEPQSCYGYGLIRCGAYVTVWDFNTNAVATEVPLNGTDPVEYATFPCLFTSITDWYYTLSDWEGWEDLFTESTEGAFTPDPSFEETSGDQSYSSTTTYNQIQLFGGRMGTKTGAEHYSWWWTDEGACGISSEAEDDVDLETTEYSGFSLLAQNGSGARVDWYTKTVTSSDVSDHGIVTCEVWEYAYSKSHVVSRTRYTTYPLFISTNATQTTSNTTTLCNSIGWIFGTSAKYCGSPDRSGETVVGSDPNSIILPAIQYQTYYNAESGGIFQAFAVKEVSTYRGYGTSDIGLEDAGIDPTTLSEKAALSSAIEQLITSAGSINLVTLFKK